MVNDQLAEMLGYWAEEMVGCPMAVAQADGMAR